MKFAPLCFALLLVPLATLHAASRPNFILFLIDDQNAESIGAFGGRTFTPNLDRMAAEGMKFTRAHVSSAVCTPSRYAWMTGRYAGASHSKQYDQECGGADRQGFVNFNMGLEHDRMNVARVLSEAGYATGFTGKFHLESPEDWPEFFSGTDGFQEVARDAEPSAETSAVFAHNELVARRYLQAQGFTWAKHVYKQNMMGPYDNHNPDWTVEAALEFLSEYKDKPFYLHITPTLLHGGSNSWRRSMDHPLDSGAGELKSAPAVMTPRAELLARVKAAGFDPGGSVAGEAWLDDAVGAVLRKLADLGLAQNTLIVFAPDHGRDGKGSLFQHNGTCIPMIARWPALIPAGSVCDELVQNIDWAPTCFDLAGAKPPADYSLQGRSLAPLLDDGKAEAWRDHLYFEMGHARSVATKDFSYIAVRYPQEVIAQIHQAKPERLPRIMSYIANAGIGTRGAEHPGFWDSDQLYDLRNDPGELANLASNPEHASQLKELRALLTADLRLSGRPFGELIPGGNAAGPGQVDSQIATVKMIDLGRKKVIPPEGDESEPLEGKKRKASTQSACPD